MSASIAWSPVEIRELLADLESSGLSVAAFARARGIPAQRIYWIRRRARMAASRDSDTPVVSREFSEIVVAERQSHPSPPIELCLQTGISIRVSADFDELVLRRLLGVLAPC